MDKFMIANSQSGNDIYINLISSSAGKYLSRRPYLINIIKEALVNNNLKGLHMEVEIDMGRVIGSTDIVETSEKDNIYYAQPVKNANYSRFVKNRPPQPSRKLTIIVQKDDIGNYEVTDTWIGPCSPPFPGHENATDESRPYWENHALVQDAQIIQSRSITKVCPY